MAHLKIHIKLNRVEKKNNEVIIHGLLSWPTEYGRGANVFVRICTKYTIVMSSNMFLSEIEREMALVKHIYLSTKNLVHQPRNTLEARGGHWQKS